MAGLRNYSKYGTQGLQESTRVCSAHFENKWLSSCTLIQLQPTRIEKEQELLSLIGKEPSGPKRRLSWGHR